MISRFITPLIIGVLLAPWSLVSATQAQEAPYPRNISRNYESVADLEARTFASFGDGQLVAIAAAGRGGVFEVETEDISAIVTADPGKCVAIPNPADATGATGGYLRQDYLSKHSIRPEWCAVTAGTGDNSAAVANAVTLAESGAVDSMRIELGPGEYRTNTTSWDSADDGLQIIGAGEHVTELTTATDDEPIVVFGATAASGRTSSYSLRDVALKYEGAGDASAGCYIELWNTSKAVLENVSVDEAFCGAKLDAVQHTVFDGYRTATLGRSAAAGTAIEITSTQADLNSAGTHLSNVELAFGPPGSSTPVNGLLVSNADGLYASNVHCQGATYCFRFEPSTGTTQDYVLSTLLSNIYSDASGANNYRLAGEADNAFKWSFLSNFQFRSAGGNGANLNPDVEFKHWLASNGGIQQADQTGVFVGEHMKGVLLNNLAFDDNNTDDGAYGDLDIRGDNVTLIGSHHVGGDAAGYAVQVGPTASGVKLIGVDLRDSDAGTLINFSGAAKHRELEIHASNETDQVRRWDRDFYQVLGVADLRVTVDDLIYELQTDELVTFETTVNCIDTVTGNFNSYVHYGTSKNVAGTASQIDFTLVASHEDDPTTNPVNWVASGDSVELKLKGSPNVASAGDMKCSGEVKAVSSLH